MVSPVMKQLRILTFNAGLLRALGGLLEPSPFGIARRTSMPAALRASGAEIVLLQEVYDDASRRILGTALPHCATPPREMRIGLQSGLMALSQHPIRATFHPFRNGTIEERLFDRKGFAVISLPPVTVVNFHATAGGLCRSPESAGVEKIRARQIDELLEVVESADLCVLAGDLNAGPGVSETNYRQLERAGFIDAYAIKHPESRVPTWDPANPLNAHGPHKTSPAQRCDHIFVRGPVEVLECAITLTEPVVAAGGRTVSLSDHYAVSATLQFEL